MFLDNRIAHAEEVVAEGEEFIAGYAPEVARNTLRIVPPRNEWGKILNFKFKKKKKG